MVGIYVIGGSTNDEGETARMDVFDVASPGGEPGWFGA
jgi:hypothetical protein